MTNTGSTRSRHSLRIYAAYALLAAVLVACVFVRIRLLSVPLERDEGEFAYMAQLLLKGFSPFSYAYTMKIPGASVVYALSMLVFGQTPSGVHLGLLVANLATVFVIWLIGRRLYGVVGAAVAAAAYAALSLSPSVLGFHAHTTHFMVLFALTGFYLLLRYLEAGGLPLVAASGLAFGIAFTMKQHAFMFLVAGCLYLLYGQVRRPEGRRATAAALAFFAAAGSLPYLAVALYIALAGDFDKFWFWTVRYAYQYSIGSPLAVAVEYFTGTFASIVKANPLLWMMALAGLMLMFFMDRLPAQRIFLLVLLLSSLFALCPGLVFRPHYFIMLLPAGACIDSLERIPAAANLSVALSLVACLHGFYLERVVLWWAPPLVVSRQSFGRNPFPEAVEIARYLKQNSAPSDRVAVLGSEPEILFYADRLSATGYIYMYG